MNATESHPRSVTDVVLEDHRLLRQMLDDFEAFLARPRPPIGEKGYHTWGSELAQRLVTLHDRLFRHFRREEEGGLFEELRMQHPRATPRLDRCLGEHPTILRSLRELMDEALGYSQGDEPVDPRLRRRVGAVLRQLERHEEYETDLFQRLSMRDLGSVEGA
jgi:hypothetical protein